MSQKKQQRRNKKRKQRVAEKKKVRSVEKDYYFQIAKAGRHSFPFDLHQQLKRIITHSHLTNKQWRKLEKENPDAIFYQLAGLAKRTVTDPEAFAKYYPRILVKPTWFKNMPKSYTFMAPMRVERHFINDKSFYYRLDTGRFALDIPKTDEKQVVFTKHALERFAKRFQKPANNKNQFDLNSFELSIFTALSIKMARDKKFTFTHEVIDGENFLHCHGIVDKHGEAGYGYFPMVFRDGVAVCKTFLFEDWVDDDIDDDPDDVNEEIDEEINKVCEDEDASE